MFGIGKYNNSEKAPCVESIPQGGYCYDEEGLCPYWTINKNKPHQMNGYCHFMKKGDWHFDGLSLIWNRVKECTIFTEINEYNYNIHSKMKTLLKKISLWGTISEKYTFWKKVDIVLHGKICRCKFCKKYFLRQIDATNVTMCDKCWLSKMINRKKNSSTLNKIVEGNSKRSTGNE